MTDDCRRRHTHKKSSCTHVLLCCLKKMDKRKGERNEREAEDRSEREWLAFSDDWQHMLFANPPPLQKHSPVRSVRAKCSSPLFPVMMSPGKAKDTLKLISGHCNLFWGCSPHPLCVFQVQIDAVVEKRPGCELSSNKGLLQSAPLCLICINANYSHQKCEAVAPLMYYTEPRVEWNGISWEDQSE